MRVELELPVASNHLIKRTVRLESTNFGYQLNADEDGVIRSITFTARSTSEEDFPKITHKDGEPPHINVSAPTVGFLLADARVAEGMLSVYGIRGFDFNNVTVRWLPESDAEKSRIVIPSFSYSVSGPRAVPTNTDVLQLLLQGLIASRRAHDLEIPLSFFRKGHSAFASERYVEAIYEFYFMIESEFGNGKFKERDVVKEFSAQSELVSVTELLLRQDSSLLLQAKDVEALSLYKESTFHDFWREIVRLRGKLHHHSKRNKRAWHPVRQNDYHAPATALKIICQRIATSMFCNYAMDETTITTLRSSRVTQQI